MNATELIQDAPRGPGQARREIALQMRLLLLYLADHVHDARLLNGMPVRDVTDFHLWLGELAEAAREAAKRDGQVTSLPDADWDEGNR